MRLFLLALFVVASFAEAPPGQVAGNDASWRDRMKVSWSWLHNMLSAQGKPMPGIPGDPGATDSGVTEAVINAPGPNGAGGVQSAGVGAQVAGNGAQTNAQPGAPVTLPPGPTGPALVSAAQIACAMECSSALASQYESLVNESLRASGATTYARVVMWLAQMGHESMGLQAMTERGSNCRSYEGRRSLGNTQPGDGCKYKGRGPIQLTGRANYQACGRAIGLDLVGNPDSVAQPAVGFRTASWYWSTRNCNDGSDRGDVYAVTRRINGGTNGLADRRRRYAKARQCIPMASFGRPAA